MKRLALCALLIGAALLPAMPALAQAPALDAARAQLENIKPDSAFALLSSYTPPRGTALETRYWTLLAFAQLLRGQEGEAQRAFRNALDVDASLTIDSLTYLQSDAARIFAAAKTDLRRALGAPLPVTVITPADTTFPPFEGRLPIELRPHLRSRVVVTIAPERDRLNYVFADTEDVVAAATTAWDLQEDGRVVPAGRYVLRVTAIDALHRAAPAVERLIVLSRLPVDTIVPPADLTAETSDAPSALEQAPAPGVSGGSSRLLLGAAFGLGAVTLNALTGNHALNSGGADHSRYLVAGAVSAAAIIGWLSGHHPAAPAAVPVAAAPPPPSSEETERADALHRIALENARRRSMAPVRVQTGGR